MGPHWHYGLKAAHHRAAIPEDGVIQRDLRGNRLMSMLWYGVQRECSTFHVLTAQPSQALLDMSYGLQDEHNVDKAPARGILGALAAARVSGCRRETFIMHENRHGLAAGQVLEVCTHAFCCRADIHLDRPWRDWA